MRWLLSLLAVLTLSQAEAKETVVAALSQNQIAITTDFDGSEIFIYGAIKRFAPPPDTPLDVAVVVIGPSEPVTVRKKVRRYGIWVNNKGVQVDSAPSFYAIATSGPFNEVVSHTTDLQYRIGLDYAVRLIGNTSDKAYPGDYREALIRLNERNGLYFEHDNGVTITDATLFQTRVRLPAQLVEGDYRARIFLLRSGKVIDVHESEIMVRKVGLERWIYMMATEHSAIYGLLSILLALVAGWTASTFFRLFL
ncbi:TIGR02186 family protein [Rhodobacteraceae bacterium NNCM2]|nr:TIGR02186 family protein [Coraliihabitans acroporae]